jgi:hypothetical protein
MIVTKLSNCLVMVGVWWLVVSGWWLFPIPNSQCAMPNAHSPTLPFPIPFFIGLSVRSL